MQSYADAYTQLVDVYKAMGGGWVDLADAPTAGGQGRAARRARRAAAAVLTRDLTAGIAPTAGKRRSSRRLRELCSTMSGSPLPGVRIMSVGSRVAPALVAAALLLVPAIARASFLSGDALDTWPTGLRSSCSSSCPSSSSSCSGSSTSCPRRSPRSATIPRRTRSTRCACCRCSSAAAVADRMALGLHAARSPIEWRTAPTSTRTISSSVRQGEGRRSPGCGHRSPARRARRDGRARPAAADLGRCARPRWRREPQAPVPAAARAEGRRRWTSCSSASTASSSG